MNQTFGLVHPLGIGSGRGFVTGGEEPSIPIQREQRPEQDELSHGTAREHHRGQGLAPVVGGAAVHGTAGRDCGGMDA